MKRCIDIISTTHRYGNASRTCSQWFVTRYTAVAAIRTVSSPCVQGPDGLGMGSCGSGLVLIPESIGRTTARGKGQTARGKQMFPGCPTTWRAHTNPDVQWPPVCPPE